MEIVTYLIEKGANVTRKCTMDGATLLYIYIYNIAK